MDSEHANNIMLPYNKQTEVLHDLSQTATKIALQNFEWSYITFVFFNSTLWYGVNDLLRAYGQLVIVGRGTFYPKFARKTRQFIIFGTNVNDLLQTLQWMQAHEFDNTGRHIIICQSLQPNDCDEEEAFPGFWSYKVTNMIFLKSVQNEIEGYTYFPLNDSACKYADPVKLKNLTTCLDLVSDQDPCNIYAAKFRNFNLCPLLVSSFIQTPYMKIEDGTPSGSDGDLVRMIAEKLNGSLKIMTPRIGNGWGKLEINMTWSGSLADVYYDYANLSITSCALTRARFSYFHLSAPYNSASVVWITHPPKKIPASLKLMYPFQQNAQLALAISFVSVVICSIIIRSGFWFRFSRQIKINRPKSGVIFYSWMICMGLPSTKLPTKTAFLYIVLLWIWYCVLIRTFYQVSLISALKTNYFYEDFKSIGDAVAAKYPFGGGAALKDYYLDNPIVFDEWTDVNTPDIVPTLRNLSLGKEFVLIMDMETAKTVIWNEKIHVHILPQKVITSPTVIFFKKFSPLADSINSILDRLVESGFTDKLYKYYTSKKVVEDKGNSMEPIKIDHYKGCYAILLGGWIISFLLFIAEQFYDKFQKKKPAIS